MWKVLAYPHNSKGTFSFPFKSVCAILGLGESETLIEFVSGATHSSRSWEGWFKNPYGHEILVHFALTTSDASALFIGGKLILDNMGKTGKHEELRVETKDPVVLPRKKKVKVAFYWDNYEGRGYGKFEWKSGFPDLVNGGECVCGGWERRFHLLGITHNPQDYL